MALASYYLLCSHCPGVSLGRLSQDTLLEGLEGSTALFQKVPANTTGNSKNTAKVKPPGGR